MMDTLPQHDGAAGQAPATDEEFLSALDAALSEPRDPLAGNGGWAAGRTTHRVENPVYPRQQIQTLSHTHEFIMNWLIANPGRPLKELSQAIGYSQAYLSILIHSDLFQARLREKQDECFSALKEDLTTKLGALADIGVEKLTEQLESSADPRFIHEVTKTALANLGFGAKAAGANTVNAANVQQNFYVASPADLEAARGRMARQGGPVSSSEPQAPSAPEGATPTPTLPAPGLPGLNPGEAQAQERQAPAPRNADQAQVPPPLEPDPIQVFLRSAP